MHASHERSAIPGAMARRMSLGGTFDSDVGKLVMVLVASRFDIDKGGAGSRWFAVAAATGDEATIAFFSASSSTSAAQTSSSPMMARHAPTRLMRDKTTSTKRGRPQTGGGKCADASDADAAGFNNNARQIAATTCEVGENSTGSDVVCFVTDVVFFDCNATG